MKFRFVDKIGMYESGRCIRGVKSVSFEEYQLRSAFDYAPHLPESLLMEALFQLGNWLIILTSDFTRMGLLIRFQKIHFITRTGPGSTLHMDAQVRRYREDGVLFDGQVAVNRHVIARGTGCLATLVPLAQYHDPVDLKVLFSEIYRPSES